MFPDVSKKQIGGYYASWKTYTTCKVEDIDPSLFTILYYAFAGIHENGSIKVLDEWADIAKGGYKKFTMLKNKNPKLKTLLAIGGWNDGSIKYSNMVANSTSRKTFIDSCLDYANKYNFDGIDIDWEYPGARGGSPEDKKNFATLLKEIKEEFKKYGYILSVAVSISASSIPRSYDVVQISKYADFINLMAYDMHSFNDGKTGENAPLYSTDNNNIHRGVNAWISEGSNRQKLILGVPAYGKTFTLKTQAENTIGAPTVGPGLPGPLSKSSGILYYSEIKENIKAGWTLKWSSEQKVPYLYQNDQWIGFDNEQSINEKIQYLKNNSLGGIMLWSVDMDDPRGGAGTNFPLLKFINSKI